MKQKLARFCLCVYKALGLGLRKTKSRDAVQWENAKTVYRDLKYSKESKSRASAIPTENDSTRKYLNFSEIFYLVRAITRQVGPEQSEVGRT